jgi:hypothetical protein
MKEFASEIYAAVRSGRVAQPFNSVMVKQVLSWLGRWNVQNMPWETGILPNCTSEFGAASID